MKDGETLGDRLTKLETLLTKNGYEIVGVRIEYDWGDTRLYFKLEALDAESKGNDSEGW